MGLTVTDDTHSALCTLWNVPLSLFLYPIFETPLWLDSAAVADLLVLVFFLYPLGPIDRVVTNARCDMEISIYCISQVKALEKMEGAGEHSKTERYIRPYLLYSLCFLSP